MSSEGRRKCFPNLNPALNHNRWQNRSGSGRKPDLFRNRLVVQQIRDALHEARQIQRLGEEILRLHRHRAPGDFARERAHEDDRDFFRGRLAFQNFADRQAVEVGQQDVEKDQIRLELPRLAQRLHAVVGNDQVVALRREFVLQQLDKIVLVIHQQNPVWHPVQTSEPPANHNDGEVKVM